MAQRGPATTSSHAQTRGRSWPSLRPKFTFGNSLRLYCPIVHLVQLFSPVSTYFRTMLAKITNIKSITV